MGKKKKKKIGRARVLVEREANGRAKRPPPSERQSAPTGTVLLRMREIARQMSYDKNWGTPLGNLFLEKKISHFEFQAGQKWDVLADRARKALNSPSPNPKPGAIRPYSGGKSAELDPFSERGKTVAAADRLTRQKYEAAETELLSHGGKPVLEAVKRLCEGQGERPVGHAAYLAALQGLKILAEFWDLTSSG